jgi:hypothetical protein
MTAEASKAEATKRPAPAFRKPNQTRAGRHRQRMAADFVAALGGADRVNPLQLEDIHRAADLVVLAKTARGELAAGKTSIDDVVKLENAADRAVRRLNLPAAGAAPAVTGSIHDHVARRLDEREGSD